MGKVKKFFFKPGLYWRDWFLKRYPIEAPDGNGRKPVGAAPPRPNAQADIEPLPVLFPIDVVYTWVDDSDPEFVRERAKWLSGVRGSDGYRPASIDPARFQSRDELKYSLRSIETYAPWVNHIWIVTNGQKPTWLDLDSPKVSIVPHDEIIPRKFLPTFNSHVIETCLHRIPGLAEHYLYFNDDVFLTRSVGPEYFFNGNGLARVFVTNAKLPNGPVSRYDTPTESAAKNARRLIADRWGFHMDALFAHTVHPQIKAINAANEARFADAVDRCRQNRFRHETDVLFATFLHHHTAHIEGKAILARTSFYYFNIRVRSAVQYYRMLLTKKDTGDAPYSMCLNDHVSAASKGFEDYASALATFLEAYYPCPSAFEKTEASSAEMGAPNSQTLERQDWPGRVPAIAANA